MRARDAVWISAARRIAAGAPMKLKLKPDKSKDARKIATALDDGKKAKAKLTITLTDTLGNKWVETPKLKLKAT